MQDRLTDGGVTTGWVFDQQAHLVLGGQSNRDQFLRWRHLAFAHQIECIFDMVGEGGDGVETEHRARALDRVQRTKCRVGQRHVSGRALEIEQRLLQLFEQFLRFLQE